MSEVLNMKHQTEDVSMKVAEDDDCSGYSNAVSNNNYKMTRDDAEAESYVSSEDVEDAETQSEIKMSVEDTYENEDKTTAEDLSTLSTSTSDCSLSSSMTSAPRHVEPKTGPLTFSIDRIMASRNDDVVREKEAVAMNEEITDEGSRRERPQQTPVQRGHARLWTQSDLSPAAAAGTVRRQNVEGDPGNKGAASWLSRLQQETRTRRHQQANLDWRSSSSLSTLLTQFSPLLLLRHLQSSMISSWLNAARYTSPGTSSSRSGCSVQHQQLQPAAMQPGRLAWNPTDSERRHPAYTSCSYPTTTRKLETDGGRQNLTAADRSSRNKMPEISNYATSGALDLSRRSTVDHHPHSTNDTSALEMTLSKNNTDNKQSDAKMWLPVVDLKNSLENIVKEEVKRPDKHISCPVCGKMFNAHYNLTRHMPVHTGARPYICKV